MGLVIDAHGTHWDAEHSKKVELEVKSTRPHEDFPLQHESFEDIAENQITRLVVGHQRRQSRWSSPSYYATLYPVAMIIAGSAGSEGKEV